MRTRSIIVVGSLLALGCAGATPLDPLGTLDPSDTPMPSYALMDVNPTSATFGTEVSSDDLRGRVGAWYYGHAT